MGRLRRAGLAAGGAILAAALWWRKNPSACPYGQRFWLEPPHPLITRKRLRAVLAPRAGERILEVGPGTGYYSLCVAEWIEPGGRLDIFDLQQEMLDHTIERARERGIWNITPTQGTRASSPTRTPALTLPTVAVLGEVHDQNAALRELAHVLKPGGRLVVGELFGDPHWVSPRKLAERARSAGMVLNERSGSPLGYFARLERPAAPPSRDV